MKKETKKKFRRAMAFLMGFVLWTAAVMWIDVQPIGPGGSEIGLAALNQSFRSLTDVHMDVYLATDWLSLIPLAVILFFGILGLIQWIRRKDIRKVDYSILVLGGFYAAVMAVYLLFEELAVNFRPVLIEGVLESSYPSSTTVLVICVMQSAKLQLISRTEDHLIRKWMVQAIQLFTMAMVAARAISGVHWISDIIGGILLGIGLVMLYESAISIKE